MKTIIAGSRTIADEETVRTAIDATAWEITEVVSGGARGVDTIGERIAEAAGIPVKVFPADWDTYGKAAGHKRNFQMAQYADALIAVWDGYSRGTKNMIDTAISNNLCVYVHNVLGK